MRRLVDRLAVMVELGDRESIVLRERFQNDYPQLERALLRIIEDHRILPDRFSGTVAYNLTSARLVRKSAGAVDRCEGLAEVVRQGARQPATRSFGPLLARHSAW